MTIKLLLFVFPALLGLKYQKIIPATKNHVLISIARDSVPQTVDSPSAKKDSPPPLHTIVGKDILTVTASFPDGAIVVTLKNGNVYTYHMNDWDCEDYYQSTDPSIDQAISSVKRTFTKAEQMPEFPGGNDAWEKYLGEYCVQHQDEIERYGPAELMVSFIVHAHGQLTNIQLITGKPNSKLSDLAIDCIKNSPAWIPAVQNGHIVICYQRQLIKFSIKN
jgi:hypothetical protein